MNHDPNFPRFGQQSPQQYGLQSFDTPPAKRGMAEKIFGPRLGQKLSSPLFATSALLLAGVAFAAIIMAAYPNSPDDTEIPVVKADRTAFKAAPDDPGGLRIENRDSTIFSTMNNARQAETAPIENLLDDADSRDKLAAFARQVEETIEEEQGAADRPSQEIKSDMPTLAKAGSESSGETAPVTLQKIVAAEKPEASASTETAQAEKPKIVHKAGENPETLEFVRSVLDKKDERFAVEKTASGRAPLETPDAVDVATRAASVQPAAGDPTAPFTITPGNHYVQLASVKSLDGAEGEWGKLQKAFSVELANAEHRVQAAELGERGTFYRIQAGPMSKDSAVEICESIKAQKPGGCLVVQ